MRVFAREVGGGFPPLGTFTNKGGGGSKKGHFYVNVKIQFPLKEILELLVALKTIL